MVGEAESGGRLRRSTRSAEKLGDSRKPGFQATAFRNQCAGLVVVADAAEGGQQVGKRRFLLPRIPGAVGEAEKAAAVAVEPDDHQRVEDRAIGAVR